MPRPIVTGLHGPEISAMTIRLPIANIGPLAAVIAAMTVCSLGLLCAASSAQARLASIGASVKPDVSSSLVPAKGRSVRVVRGVGCGIGKIARTAAPILGR
jgi:hypothetical protein